MRYALTAAHADYETWWWNTVIIKPLDQKGAFLSTFAYVMNNELLELFCWFFCFILFLNPLRNEAAMVLCSHEGKWVTLCATQLLSLAPLLTTGKKRRKDQLLLIVSVWPGSTPLNFLLAVSSWHNKLLRPSYWIILSCDYILESSWLVWQNHWGPRSNISGF